ncbi:MAG: hypothetical protein RLZZ499_2107, partial [Cyanobacteriota bacterium]
MNTLDQVLLKHANKIKVIVKDRQIIVYFATAPALERA